MPSKELIEKVASHFEFPDKETTLVTAENILNEILAALQEPTERMLASANEEDWDADYDITFSDCWRVMLAASALGEQSE
ncbi:hypothetical protein [Ochrobactrum sp. A-1]|uniref:hypothetical protein n=1 Tax=Ochrobactrum sp. A-1 TaxID=2920940 RepID=UPI001F0AB2EF|nr:hypothetical protein [Ochrobactrum sp. A-1]